MLGVVGIYLQDDMKVEPRKCGRAMNGSLWKISLWGVLFGTCPLGLGRAGCSPPAARRHGSQVMQAHYPAAQAAHAPAPGPCYMDAGGKMTKGTVPFVIYDLDAWR